MPSLNPRAKKDLYDMGYEYVEIVEHWVSFGEGGVRRDLMGFADLLALGRDMTNPNAAVQVTSIDHMSARRKKIKQSESANIWWHCGGSILLLGYRKKKGRYERKEEWISL